MGIVDAIALKQVLSALLSTLRDPSFLLEKTLKFAMRILAKTPPVCPKECRLKDVPSLLTYYSALTRSRHLERVATALSRFYAWHVSSGKSPVVLTSKAKRESRIRQNSRRNAYRETRTRP